VGGDVSPSMLLNTVRDRQRRLRRVTPTNARDAVRLDNTGREKRKTVGEKDDTFLRRRFFSLKAHTDSVVKVGVEREKNVNVCHILETGWRSVKVPVRTLEIPFIVCVYYMFPYISRILLEPSGSLRHFLFWKTLEYHYHRVKSQQVDLSIISVPCFASICLVLNPRATEPSGPVATRD
jgi:hypothetical protein